MKDMFSIRIELDKMLQTDDYEQLVFENLERCKRIVGGPKFKVVFWHKCLDKKTLEKFAIRNKNRLFELNSQITGIKGNAWFLVKSSVEEKSNGRYRYEGDIIMGIVEYLKIINHMKRRDVTE